MPGLSAGLLVFRFRRDVPELLLVHPGGPFWAKKDNGAWSVPKGEPAPGEDLLEAAKRELHEETGLSVEGPFLALDPARQASGKVVHAWAVAGDGEVAAISSNMFSMEWPPRSGQIRQFPEVDRAGWFPSDEARRKLVKGQVTLLDQLDRLLASPRRA